MGTAMSERINDLAQIWAFVLAYVIRFESGLIPVTRGYPPIEQYFNILPFVAVLTPLTVTVCVCSAPS